MGCLGGGRRPPHAETGGCPGAESGRVGRSSVPQCSGGCRPRCAGARTILSSPQRPASSKSRAVCHHLVGLPSFGCPSFPSFLPQLPSSLSAVQVAGLGTPASAQPGCAQAPGGVESPQLCRHPFPSSSLEVRVLLLLSHLALSLSPGHRLLCLPRPHSRVIPRHFWRAISWLHFYCEGGLLFIFATTPSFKSFFPFWQDLP